MKKTYISILALLLSLSFVETVNAYITPDEIFCDFNESLEFCEEDSSGNGGESGADDGGDNGDVVGEDPDGWCCLSDSCANIRKSECGNNLFVEGVLNRNTCEQGCGGSIGGDTGNGDGGNSSGDGGSNSGNNGGSSSGGSSGGSNNGGGNNGGSSSGGSSGGSTGNGSSGGSSGGSTGNGGVFGGWFGGDNGGTEDDSGSDEDNEGWFGGIGGWFGGGDTGGTSSTSTNNGTQVQGGFTESTAPVRPTVAQRVVEALPEPIERVFRTFVPEPQVLNQSETIVYENDYQPTEIDITEPEMQEVIHSVAPKQTAWWLKYLILLLLLLIGLFFFKRRKKEVTEEGEPLPSWPPEDATLPLVAALDEEEELREPPAASIQPPLPLEHREMDGEDERQAL